jgi:excisionase family DNA binding protein
MGSAPRLHHGDGGVTTELPQFISLPEWAIRIGVSRDSAYRAARAGEIPGLFTVGKLRRVNWTAFLEATSVHP